MKRRVGVALYAIDLSGNKRRSAEQSEIENQKKKKKNLNKTTKDKASKTRETRRQCVQVSSE